MPEEGPSMNFKNYKDTMERPFMVYADWECSLLKTHDEGKTHRHKANSIGFQFLTFDDTRHKYYNFEGDDCASDVIFRLKGIAKGCIAEMRNNTELYLSVKMMSHTQKLRNAYYVTKISK